MDGVEEEGERRRETACRGSGRRLKTAERAKVTKGWLESIAGEDCVGSMAKRGRDEAALKTY